MGRVPVLFVLDGEMYFMIKYTACVSGISINNLVKTKINTKFYEFPVLDKTVCMARHCLAVLRKIGMEDTLRRQKKL